MNNFTIIGKYIDYKEIDKNTYLLNILSSSPTNKIMLTSIFISKDKLIFKIKKNDLIGVHGYIKSEENNNLLIALKIVWMPEKK